MRVGLMLICQFVRRSSSHHRPWQIAAAITLGLLLGIVPKTTALFASVCLASFLMPVHLPILAAAAFITSFAAPLLETPMAHLGYWSLTHPRLNALWFELDALPLVPWLGIHNTVVHGSLIMWSCLAIPAFASSLMLSRIMLADGVAAEAARIVDSFELVQQRVGKMELTSSQELRPLTGVLQPGPVVVATPPVVVWDDVQYPVVFERNSVASVTANPDSDFSLDEDAPSTDEILRRAADLAVWAEELIQEELLLDAKSDGLAADHSARSVTQKGARTDSNSPTTDDEERWLIETTMEVVRIAEQAVTNQAALKAKQSEELSSNSKTNQTSEDPTSQSTEASTVNLTQISSVFDSTNSAKADADKVALESTIRREQSPHSNHRSHLDTSRSGVTTQGNRPREEALHYLLRHLKGIQEKAQKQ